MASNSAAAVYDDLGIGYEEGWGHNQGLIDFVKSSIELLSKDAFVLDIGSGTGKPTSQLVIESGRKLHGIDISPVMIDLSRKQVPDATFELINMLDFNLKIKFDAAFAIFSLFHLSRDEITRAVQKFSEWLVPQGFLFIGTFDVEYSDEGAHMFDQDMECTKAIERSFKGKKVLNTFYTKEGWKNLLVRFGFEVLKTESIPFRKQKALVFKFLFTPLPKSYGFIGHLIHL